MRLSISDVTTERPSTFGARTAQALITQSTDANGAANPSSSAGGVAYVNVFGSSSYATYRPAWIYFNNLAKNESYIAEAASHEIGHNLGLSHDGTTTSSYYGGHGSGETSWGPLMGTGYNRNVSQWSKGEYYLANNTQDDLAIIAGKIAYRGDDCANTFSTATALLLSGGTNIVSTTPETDPANANPANKGSIERNNDVDVFTFTTGTGSVRLSVNPWIVPSGTTRGGNLDLVVELYDANGAFLMSTNPAANTGATLQPSLTQGRYYLAIKNTGAGSPMSSTPSGYTAYGSIGQYFISGYVTGSGTPLVNNPPAASLQVTDISQTGIATKQFTVTYSDDVAIDAATIDSNDVLVTGPNGYSRLAQLVSINLSGNGSPRVATYSVTSGSGSPWSAADSGTYIVSLQSGQVRDTGGLWVAAGQLGHFNVTLSPAESTLYTANMNANPGWTLQPQWGYGAPAYSSGNGPSSGVNGGGIIGYNLGGYYENSLAAKYATTPVINCAGAEAVTLRFQRWLRLKKGDSATIQVSTNGTTWTTVWGTTRPVSDSAWTLVEYPLPSWTAGSTSVRLRWGMASGSSQNDIGWNIDEIELVSGTGSAGSTVVNRHGKSGKIPAMASVPGADLADSPAQVRFTVQRSGDGNADLLSWNSVPGRVYTIWTSVDGQDYSPLPGASNLSWRIRTFANPLDAAADALHYRIQVERE